MVSFKVNIPHVSFAPVERAFSGAAGALRSDVGRVTDVRQQASATVRRSVSAGASYVGNRAARGLAPTGTYLRNAYNQTGLVAYLKRPSLFAGPQFQAATVVLPAEGGEAVTGVEEGARYAPEAVAGAREGVSDVSSRLGVSGAVTADKLSPIVVPSTVDAAKDVADASDVAARDVASTSTREFASGFGKESSSLGQTTARTVGTGVKWLAGGALVGGGVAVAGYLGGAGLSSLGQGLSSLVYGTAGQSGAGGGGSGGSAGGGSTGGLLGDLTSSPLVILVVVGVAAYLIISHESKKPSQSSSGGK